MKKYEKSLCLKTLWLSIIRRFDVLLICFLPLCLASIISTQFVMKRQFVSSVTLAKSTIITNEQYQNIQNAVQEETVLKKALDNLDSENVKHSDGSVIKLSEIEGGISFPTYEANSISITFSYASSDKSVSKYVLDAICSSVVNELKTRSVFSDLTVLRSASDPKLDGKNNKYMLIAIGASLILSYAVSFIYEFSSDEVYNASDIEEFGVGCTEIKLMNEKEVRKNEKEN